jgi:NADH-quinone oxidoreductase subunit L
MENLFPIKHSYLIPLLPLIGAAIAGFGCTGARKRFAHWPIWITVAGSAALSIWILAAMAAAHPQGDPPLLSVTRIYYTWIAAGNFQASVGFFFDPLTAVMLCVVCGIGFLITVFSAGYMRGEEGYARFFAYLGLFIFSMTCLVMGENLVMLYLGWEGVGLCSYLLIGHYYERPSAREAAKKAFIVNRVGDFGFALGIMLCYAAFGTISYFGDPKVPDDGLLIRAFGDPTLFQWHALRWIPFLLMLGAFGKSAQFPLHVWLPDAMEGPTPVSALIHAATMVTAGVYMIVRCGTLFVANLPATTTIAIIGALTAALGAFIALRQFDLKKIFAYSTISQLGFMFVGAGVLAPVAGVFHLVTHAFFKALLFLSSGVVMHAMAGELDIRRMGGLKHVLPVTRWLMLIGCAALAGFPLLAGFFSKDEIVVYAWNRSVLLGIVMLLVALMTAYYSFRAYFRVFHGPEIIPAGAGGHGPAAPAPHEGDVDEHLAVEHIHHHPAAAHGAHDAQASHHSHEPVIMIVPLVILALGAIFIGYVNFPKHALGHFLGESPSLYYSYQLASGRYGGPAVPPVPFGQVEVEDERVREAEEARHKAFMFISAGVAFLGIYLAWLMHVKEREAPQRLAERVPWLTRLLENKFYFDEIYQYGIVEPLRMLGRFFYAFDRLAIDGLVWIIGMIPQVFGFSMKATVQRGYLQGYALAMLLGIALILVIVLVYGMGG